MFDFEWDLKKEELNIRKHGIDFNEASSIFDADYVLNPDDGHSDDENRFIAIGYSDNRRFLMVCHCYRGNDDIIRIISARKAVTKEIQLYKEEMYGQH